MRGLLLTETLTRVCLALAKDSEGAACCTSLNSSQSEPMCSCSPQTELTVKQKVGLEMLSEAREGEFSAAFGVSGPSRASKPTLTKVMQGMRKLGD